MDDISTGPLYRLSLMDEIGAQIKDDSESIATITQRNVGFLAPMSDDPDEIWHRNLLVLCLMTLIDLVFLRKCISAMKMVYHADSKKSWYEGIELRSIG